MHPLVPILAVVSAVTATPLVLQAQTPAERLTGYFDALARVGQFNGAILVADRDRVVLKRAYGPADLASGTPLTVGSRFPIASISKTFTATAVLQLVERKVLSLDDAVATRLPGFPYPDITIAHLLSHTSGLPSYNTFFDFEQHPGRVFTNADLVAGLVDNPKPLRYPPGTNGNYDNINYAVLALILERVSGQSYVDYIQAHILKPAGMTSTAFESFCRQLDTTVSRRDAAYPHLRPNLYSDAVRTSSVPFIRQYWCAYQFHGFGEYVSTLDDLHRYARALFGGRLLTPGTLRPSLIAVRLTNGAPNPRPFGLGWEISRDSTRPGIVHHGGYAFGLSSELAYDPVRQQTVIVYDVVNGNAGSLMNTAFDLLAGRPVQPPRRQLVDLYARALVSEGPEAARRLFDSLKVDTANYTYVEQDLNALGYDLMGQPSGYRFPVVHRYEQAIAALRLNTELFPNSANVWDSYGEALLQAGRRDQALAMYRKALAIDSTYATARRMVDSLTAQP